MLYVDPNTGASFFVTLDGQVSSFVQTPQYYTPQNLEPQQCSLPLLAQHSTSTFGVQQAYSAVNNQGYKSTVAAQSQVDDLIDLVDILSQQEDPVSESQDQVAELAFSLKNSLPSTPTSSEALDSPMMHRMEPLPGISTLSAEISSLQAQLLGPLPPTPVKKQYPFYPSPAPSRVSAPQSSSILPSLPHLPTLNRPNPAQQPRKHARFQELSPESSPCSSPPPSPKRNKKNYTKEFNLRFHELLNSNEQASNEWHLYAGQHKGKCTIKRSPCIKVSRGFCASYGHEFTNLAKEEKYGALGTRTECACMHKPQPLSSSGPSRKQRQSIRSSPYPSYSSHSPSTPQELELPSTPTEPSSKNAWISFLLQNATMLHEGFNSFMGGLQCSACTARRAFASRDEVIAYLMQEPIACAQECCAGAMQLHQ